MRSGVVIFLFIITTAIGVSFYDFSYETDIALEPNPIGQVNLMVDLEGEVEEFLPAITFNTLTPKQANLVVIRAKSADRPKATFQEKEIDFFETLENHWVGFLGIDVKARPGSGILLIDFAGASERKYEISVLEQLWPVTELVLSEELESQGYTPAGVATGIQENENVVVREAVSSYRKEPYFKDKFIDPVPGRINVGFFGNIRKSGGTSLQHLGVDLDAKKGDEVSAVNNGKVVLAREDFPNYGKTVVIDHGLGIFSLYLHLSEIKVLAGHSVNRGEIIGLVGNTGYSLDPHLHFSIKVQGANLDPLKFIDTVNLSL